MSHQVGTLQTLAPALAIGPDSGTPETAPNTWTVGYAYTPAPTGTKSLILHFTGVNLPATNRLEVDLGYDTDVFTSADGAAFWTRPIDPQAVGGGTTVPIRYITNGAADGGAQLDQYGRGERMQGEQDSNALSNCDPFLHDATYVEPIYDPFWFCNNPPHWENVANIPVGDIRAAVAQSVGMILTVEATESGTTTICWTCSVTLIGPDTVICAGHCHTPEEVLSASVIFNYQTDHTGNRPAGYAPYFYKLIKVERQRWADGSGDDYSILQRRTVPGGILAVPLRGDLPAAGEQVFNVSHPNGAVKKVSLPHPQYATVASASSSAIVVDGIEVSGGGSGSGLFDTLGRYLGDLSDGSACNLSWFPLVTTLADIAAMPGAPPVDRDVMVVVDRSGSMAADSGAGDGKTKMDEAHDDASPVHRARSLRQRQSGRTRVVQHRCELSGRLRAGRRDQPQQDGPHRRHREPGLRRFDDDRRRAGGCSFAVSAPGANPRAILLPTDGLQNTPPMIADAAGMLSGIDIHAIGYGTEANLDGALLAALTESHNGLYTRAGAPLDLKKFFALTYLWEHLRVGDADRSARDPQGRAGAGHAHDVRRVRRGHSHDRRRLGPR